MATLGQQACWTLIAQNCGNVPALNLQRVIALGCPEAPITLLEAQALIESVPKSELNPLS
jgi:hypothetical protein